ncbi:MAG: phenylalanine--tRNA ligase subunit alpha [Thermoplasmata archaeon]
MAAEELSRNERRVLLAISRLGSAAPEDVVREGGFRELVEVMSAASWLRSKGLLEIHERIQTTYFLDDEGRRYVERGELPEFTLLRVLEELGRGGRVEMGALKPAGMGPEELRIALGWLRRKGWASILKEAGRSWISLTDEGREALRRGPEGEELALLRAAGREGGLPEDEARRIGASSLPLLLTRKGLLRARERRLRTLVLTERGRKLVEAGLEVGEELTQLTPELITSGAWRGVELRPYDVNTYAPAAQGGKPHILREAIKRIRSIFLHMGFTEIEGDFVESCFWDMDVLFIPQDHPARDAQDTFYLKNPPRIELPPRLPELIRQIHETGGDTGSDGWRYRWSEEEASKALLRTHTTVNTIRYLSEHPEPPVKAFSVGRVFRREATDATHLAEFHQIEGIIMEEGASFRMLMGTLKEFYERMGFTGIRFRPSYYPYTEPSLDVEVFFDGSWMELGGAGIFRPEVTAPFGIKHPVLAWGLGLERLVMKRYGIDDMRRLYLPDLEWLRNTPIL